jgi:hypothetical protein
MDYSQFDAGVRYYGVPDPQFDFGDETLHEKQYTVADLAPVAKRKFIYEYDFGDSWEHEVLLEQVLPPDPAFQHPVCLARLLQSGGCLRVNLAKNP